MVTLTFVFNKEKIEEAGYTEDELLYPMREHAQKYGIEETEPGVFSKDGEDALCVVGMFIPEFADTRPEYIEYLDEWTFNINGEIENCIKEIREWNMEHGMKIGLG